MNHTNSYHSFPLGDSAITVQLGDSISERVNETIIGLFQYFQHKPLHGIREIVPSYHTLTFHYDIVAVKKMAPPGFSAFEWIKACIENEISLHPARIQAKGNHFDIPVCYESDYAPDIVQLAMEHHIPVEEVIRIHASTLYRVYMLGFLPGFAYLGSVNDSIQAPRKAQPVKVAAGSIGIAGAQTGIYPVACPGGWQIIGRTPWSIFDPGKPEPALLKAGDTVRFYSISSHEFANH